MNTKGAHSTRSFANRSSADARAKAPANKQPTRQLMASGWREPTGMPFYRPVYTGPLAVLVPYFFAAAQWRGLMLDLPQWGLS